MSATHSPKGPWTHRWLVFFFTLLFGLLIFWLLGFFMRDLGTWPGPNYAEVRDRLSDPALTREAETIQRELDEVQRAIASREQRQKVLRDSTGNSERTMNQLLELQKLTLQKGLTPAPEESAALAESQRLFLINQTKYQEMNDQIAALNDQSLDLQNRQRSVQEKLGARHPAIQTEFDQLHARHQFKVAALKLAVLLPLLILGGWWFLRARHSLYAPLVYGFGLALLLKVGLVLHEHFPRRYFKYILIVAAIGLVARVLIYLLRIRAFPKADWLLKQYREAYEHFICPVCSHPIRRGPLQHLFWTRGSLKKIQIPAPAPDASDPPYTCPVCATVLFELCPACQHTRHALLPACAHCGATKPISPAPATPPTKPAGLTGLKT